MITVARHQDSIQNVNCKAACFDYTGKEIFPSIKKIGSSHYELDIKRRVVSLMKLQASRIFILNIPKLIGQCKFL